MSSSIAEATVDVLLENRIILFTGEVNAQSADLIIRQILYLDNQNNKKDINLYLNCCPGGSVNAGLSIIDTMNSVKSDVATVCMGMCASMGATILSAGTKGKRFILPNAEVMIHQVSSGTEGTNADIQIAAAHTKKLNSRLFKMIADNCNQPLEKIYDDCNRDFWMNSEEAIEYGIVDKIIYPKEDNKDKEDNKN